MYLRGLSQSQRWMWRMNRCCFMMAKKPATVSDCRAASTSTRPNGTGLDKHHAYCKDFVQKHDYEAYLVSRLYPIGKRGGYFAIKAFYDELAMVQDNVSSSMIGEMRMQFWRDAVKSLADTSASPHRSSSTRHNAEYASSTVSSEENCRR